MYCLISKHLLYDNARPGNMYRPPEYMYRENSDNDTDSGWRFFLGYETDEYLSDAGNIQLVDLNNFLEDNPRTSPKALIQDIPYGYHIDLRTGKTIEYKGCLLYPELYGLWIPNKTRAPRNMVIDDR